ncbi:expressed unknown protein [Seminavis robusta]|uniref:Uncharacterized protein n=1 Tax=Seminavis robusta TaxID=568900 RepID=A0A9N8E7R2_9STRA|nr:expressed unknown protein [Seminavis robusta]|eukprot:Sro586_g171170.1 n/a (570) ;mRNA; f:31529-33238
MASPPNNLPKYPGASESAQEEPSEESPVLMLVEDPLDILKKPSSPFRHSRRRMCATSSRSLSSADDNDSISAVRQEQQQQQQQDHRNHNSFPGLRRVGTFPLVGSSSSVHNNTTGGSSSGPPRRPSRSTSLERSQHNCDDTTSCGSSYHHRHLRQEESSDDDDEYDRDKFRQLLMGKCDCASTVSGSSSFKAMRASIHSAAATTEDEEFDLVSRKKEQGLKPRKSWGSAPPKFPSRMDSDTEKPAAAAVATTPNTQLGTRRPSLPLSVYRASLQGQRRRRRRSKIQDMLNPDSETSSKSVRLPPKLPSRTESDLSTDASKASIPAVLVLCNSALAATTQKSSAASVSSSQKSTCEAPKRPRRSLSPIFGESLRSLIQQQQDDDNDMMMTTNEPPPVSSNTTQQPAMMKTTATTCTMESMAVGILARKVRATPRSSTTTATTATTASLALPSIPRRKRNLPMRAKTFSFSTKSPCSSSPTTEVAFPTLPPSSSRCPPNSCLALLSHNLTAGRNMEGIAIASLYSGELSGDSLESLWTATTWPKPKRKKVAPGRSRTFNTSYQPTAIASRC